MNKEPTTEERLENAIRHQPNRYIVRRNEDGNLTRIYDTNTDRLWIKTMNFDWMCIQ